VLTSRVDIWYSNVIGPLKFHAG